MSQKIQFDYWKPWKLFTQKLLIHKDMLHTHQCLPEQKPNSKQEKTFYGKKRSLHLKRVIEKISYTD